MKSKLIALGAAGALMMALIPVAAAADGNTNTEVTVFVDAGTTIYAPATALIGGADPGTGQFPGMTVVSASAESLQWMSNDSGAAITAEMTTALTDGFDVIPAADVLLGMPTVDGTVYATWHTMSPVYTVVSNVMGNTSVATGRVKPSVDTKGSQAFKLQLLIPSVELGEYVGDITWAVVTP
jgi:hypothetical protein